MKFFPVSEGFATLTTFFELYGNSYDDGIDRWEKVV
jgi:hypothetical protein